MAKIKLKIKKNTVSQKGFRMFNLAAGQKVEFTFAGEKCSRSTTKSWWILLDNHAKFSKEKYNVEGEIEIEKSEFRLQKSEYTDEESGKIRHSTWLIPVALADDTCEEWD